MIILAVDDEKLALEGLLKSIREAEPGAEVVGFRKPSEAMEYFKEHTCDVVFLDIQMRGVNGVNLAKEMKLLRPQINVIFATGYLDYMGEAFSLHASGYIVKPITTIKVRAELDDLRHPVQEASPCRVMIYRSINYFLFVSFYLTYNFVFNNANFALFKLCIFRIHQTILNYHDVFLLTL